MGEASRSDLDRTEAALLAPKFDEPAVNVSIGNTSDCSDQLAAGLYRVVADVACYIRQGDDPTADATDGHRLPADMIDYVDVEGANDGKVAAINTATDVTGTLKLTRL